MTSQTQSTDYSIQTRLLISVSILLFVFLGLTGVVLDRAFRNSIEAGAADILMPDLQRIGGLTEMLRVAHLAGAHNLPISTHIFTEQSLSIAGSCHNCISVEHMPWYSRLYKEPMVLEGGKLNMPTGHGLGFTFNGELLNHYAIN